MEISNSRFECDRHFSKVAVKMTIDKEKLPGAGYLKSKNVSMENCRNLCSL